MEYDDTFIFNNIINKYNLDSNNISLIDLNQIYHYNYKIYIIDLDIKSIHNSVKKYLSTWSLNDSNNKKKYKKTNNIIIFINKYINIQTQKKQKYLQIINTLLISINNNQNNDLTYNQNNDLTNNQNNDLTNNQNNDLTNNKNNDLTNNNDLNIDLIINDL